MEQRAIKGPAWTITQAPGEDFGQMVHLHNPVSYTYLL